VTKGSRGPGFALGRAVGGFGSSVIVMGLVNVASVPVVIATAGADVWAGIAVAQSIASFAAVVVLFGWGVTGPADVARGSVTERGARFRDSVASRCWIAIPVLPGTMALVIVLAPGDRAANVLAAFALLLPALGAAWFFVGERAPGQLLALETAPRAGGTVLGALALLTLEAPLVAFSGAQAAGAALAVLLSWRSVFRRHPGRLTFQIREDLRRLQRQRAGVVTAVTAAFYVSMPLVLAGALLPAQAPVYALADKLQKLVLTAISPLFQVTQGFVAGREPEDVRIRARRVSAAALPIGLAVGVGFALAGSLGTTVLSGGRIEVPILVIVLLGVALASICTTAVVGLSCLTALGAVRPLAVSTVIGALVGVPLIVLGATTGGITGIAAAAAVSEVAVAVYQVRVVWRLTATPTGPGSADPRTAQSPSIVATAGGAPLG
jgi:O-antigen/teichoic acid export membrane protein